MHSNWTVLCLFHLKWFCTNCWALGLIKLIVISVLGFAGRMLWFFVRFNYVLAGSISKLINMFCFLFSVLVSEPTNQVKKIRTKDDVRLSDHSVKPVWPSWKQSSVSEKTAVCEPIPSLRPLEASWIHLLSTGGRELRRSTILQTDQTSQESLVSPVKPVYGWSFLPVTSVPPWPVPDQTCWASKITIQPYFTQIPTILKLHVKSDN